MTFWGGKENQKNNTQKTPIIVVIFTKINSYCTNRCMTLSEIRNTDAFFFSFYFLFSHGPGLFFFLFGEKNIYKNTPYSGAPPSSLPPFFPLPSFPTHSVMALALKVRGNDAEENTDYCRGEWEPRD